MPVSPSPLPLMRCGLSPRLRSPSVFSHPVAMASGMSRGRLDRADLSRIGQGIFRVCDRPYDPMDHLRALQDLHPEAAFTHTTAARVLGLWLTGAPDRDPVIHLGRRRATGGVARRPGVQHHWISAHAPLQVVDGVRVTGAAWTLVDLAGMRLELEQLVTVGDSMLRVGRTPYQQRRLGPGVVGRRAITEVLEARSGARGMRLLRQAVPLMRSGVDSRMETRLRLRLGEVPWLPEPLVNPEVRTSSLGAFWVDLVWPRWKVCLEYDGDQHRTDRAQYRRDQQRDRALRADGWEVLHVSHEVFGDLQWKAFLMQLEDTFRAQGWRPGL